MSGGSSKVGAGELVGPKSRLKDGIRVIVGEVDGSIEVVGAVVGNLSEVAVGAVVGGRDIIASGVGDVVGA